MTTYLTDYLADGKNIPDSEREVIRYGVEGILNNLLGIFITVTVGIFCDCVFEVACFGFPLDTAKACRWISCEDKNFDV